MGLRDLMPWNKAQYSPTGVDLDEDCMSCRVIGSTALASLGFYTYYSGMRQLREQRRVIEMSKSRYKYNSRQLGIVSISATLIGLGWYRMVN
ncbi:uncharacterized protein HMPREF1541_03489 [Cyphellophora europaea CBS 101466]|uniref:Distal membrane-arm assembly complex protein 1-like domain-containing protein n=1 Tax=Cyphellophora europaea (strain CBS 101466) TaxID=1220924 RepID=W2S0I8_CYPE1|nr:uncharacterized protein HMPREF1541_03489 [Cyphellophora europaea CBS 101466]ETN41553.1 hypothetical protein HMPREF1541_03489 [Cyphellophora europaea CBS 101466]